jgi:dipeptidyl-peptidase 4
MKLFKMTLKSIWACALLFLAVQLPAQKLTLDEAVLGQFRQFAPQTLDQLQWMGKSDVYTHVKDNAVKYTSASGKGAEKTLFTLEQLNKWKGGTPLTAIPEIHWLGLDKFYFDENGKVYEMEMKAEKATVVCEYIPDSPNADYHAASHNLAYTKDNDLYVMSEGRSRPVTQNTAGIVSGQSISRNEYGIEKGTFWSPSGAKLAFYQKDETHVTDYPLTNYKEFPATVKMIKYPMAGNVSEQVSVGVYDLTTSKKIFLQLETGKASDQFYATNLAWSPDNNTIYIAWLNRKTTDMKMMAFDATTGKEIKTLFTEHSDKWLEPQHPILFVPEHNDQFLWMSDRDGFTNLYLYNTKGELNGMTTAKWEITSILGFDLKGEHVFVMGTGENPTESNCYKINLKSMAHTLVTSVHGTHRVQVSGSGKFFIDQYSNLTTPNIIDLIDEKGKILRNLVTAKNPYEGRKMGQSELFSIKANDNTDLWCRLIKPSNFDPAKKYPVVVYLYNGPHVQLVTNSFLGGASLWMNYLAEEGYLVFTIDGRGSSNRGRDFEKAIHRQLGTKEIEDQMAGVEWLKKQPFVDAARMGIHGWSFGGFMTTSMMLRQPGTFKVGVAGGPVIDWKLYEVMYTERYMDTPDENPEGYKTADLTNYVTKLQGKILMIHGTDDDVVVMQHNMKFLKSAIENKVQVDFFAYPGHAHNVRGKDRVHLMTKVIDYLIANI